MALSPRILCFLCVLLASTATSQSLAIANDNVISLPIIYPIEPITTVRDLISQHGLPKGLLPDLVKSYSLSRNGDFRVELKTTCYVDAGDLLYYDKRISGKLRHGAISHLQGIRIRKLWFWWVIVTEIQADEDRVTLIYQSISGLIWFSVFPIMFMVMGD
ncbi:PREDICTED: uncharacterized protein LOC104587504 [Nelumbo nucifera]|uniref:Uncharacterized protein n=2 Tax=Nelumbo nucifera TaxID=4432 RepID=A0A822YGM2_NELNU|nr:PREDICTED: uncharacterized protein LOC104587504 [Nelumbo nucifera]DAD30096.1 TPA_asm: hypothetical protein HUJ06_031564 [Nelumbo nucifera]